LERSDDERGGGEVEERDEEPPEEGRCGEAEGLEPRGVERTPGAP
jgi:hypothetical protein